MALFFEANISANKISSKNGVCAQQLKKRLDQLIHNKKHRNTSKVSLQFIYFMGKR